MGCTFVRVRSQNDALCPLCKGKDIIRNGIRKTNRGTNQKFKCLSCDHRFVMESHGSRYASDIINYGKMLREGGLTLQQIQDDILKNHGVKIQRTTIMRWSKVKKMDPEKWIGKCLDCNFSVEGNKTYIQNKGCDHELEYPGHWVEYSLKN